MKRRALISHLAKQSCELTGRVEIIHGGEIESKTGVRRFPVMPR